MAYAWEVSEAQIPSMYRQATLEGIERWFSHGSALHGYELQQTMVGWSMAHTMGQIPTSSATPLPPQKRSRWR